MKRAGRMAGTPAQRQQGALALAERIRTTLPDGHASEKRMFGGVTFLVNGNMLCCAFGHGLMLRVGTDAEAGALSQPHVRRLSETRKMPGFVFVEPAGMADRPALSHWVGMARAYVDPLPPKTQARKTDRPKTGRPKTGKPKTDRPETGKPKAGKPASGKPATGKPKTRTSKTRMSKTRASKTRTSKARKSKR